jgi:2-polyprenyl-3-methyl-5-hydroxy-6-metoxy-1,4-benzoquinol methylase
MHQRTKWGADGHKHAEKVYEIMARNGLLTALDYGCGRGTLKAKMHEIADVVTVKEYDPAIPGKNSLPAPAEMVVCTDVLEHIELGMIGGVLKHLNELTENAAYLVISCRYANAVLPNGKNAHLIVKPPDWWLIKIKKHFKGEIKAYGSEKELIVEILK